MPSPPHFSAFSLRPTTLPGSCLKRMRRPLLAPRLKLGAGANSLSTLLSYRLPSFQGSSGNRPPLLHSELFFLIDFLSSRDLRATALPPLPSQHFSLHLGAGATSPSTLLSNRLPSFQGSSGNRPPLWHSELFFLIDFLSSRDLRATALPLSSQLSLRLTTSLLPRQDHLAFANPCPLLSSYFQADAEASSSPSSEAESEELASPLILGLSPSTQVVRLIFAGE